MQTHYSLTSLNELIRLTAKLHTSHYIVGLQEAQKVWLLSSLIEAFTHPAAGKRGRLLIVHSDPKYLQSLEALARANVAIKQDLVQVQAAQYWGLHRFSSQNDIRSDRLRAMYQLLMERSSRSVFFVSFAGLMQTTASPVDFKSACIPLRKGLELDLDELLVRLSECGYRSVDQVEEPGQYAVRGGILDVFTPAYEQPIRCEFFGDLIQTLRSFASETQLSLGEVEEVCLIPIWEQSFPRAQRPTDAQRLYEALLDQKGSAADRQGLVDAFAAQLPITEMPLFLPIFRQGEPATLLEYTEEDDVFVFLEPISVCLEKFKMFLEKLIEEAADDALAQRLNLSVDGHFIALSDVKLRLDRYPNRSEWGDSSGDNESKTHKLQSAPPTEMRTALPVGLDQAGLSFWMKKLEDLQSAGHRVLILVRQAEHLMRMRSMLQHHDIDFTICEDSAVKAATVQYQGQVVICLGVLPHLHWEEREGLLILPEHLIFGEPFQIIRRTTRSPVATFRSFQDLDIGSLVVHSEHGIGRYLGMRTMELLGVRTDFLVLEYADQDRLYLPVHRLNLLQRYSASAGEEDKEASVDKLRSQGWAKRKARAKKAIKDMADQLLKIYAQRKLATRSAFTEPNDEYFQFEADFAYIETADQQKAIDEVNADLSSDQPMDRLICGDVGFGKTEVALRAAMRAVLNGQQVMVLAPTTLLSYQHWETFKARFKRYGADVGLANRFVKAEELRTNLNAFREGRLDILVGTHRLLSKDIVPHRLGLLIVDEEQRFGVGHKESIKNIKASCDVLTLTATPIPRSLHMALLGIRDISVITTPPTERLSIKTYVAQFDDELIKKAITQEVKRGGQVFFVHNRVHDILEVRGFLENLLPDVSVAVAHGQMKENNVESVIIEFIERKYSVLLCTTIIESGIDMPNVNTIIINNADRFGLAQLYQMRGRVGRSNRQSYAYFLTRGSLAEKEEARQRLEILAAHQELGVGFQIASYDMELRGTGNLLGGEQSGQMTDIGYELFLDLLEKEIAGLRGQAREPDVDPEIKIPISAALPETYISKEKLRLALYKNLFSASDLGDINRLAAEMRDRFGPAPTEANNLLGVAALKVILKILRVAQIQNVQPGLFELRFGQLNEELIKRLTDASLARAAHLSLTADFRLLVRLKNQSTMDQQLKELLEILIPLTL